MNKAKVVGQIVFFTFAIGAGFGAAEEIGKRAIHYIDEWRKGYGRSKA